MKFDFYCYGMISSSTVILLDEDFLYPRPNEYAEIKSIHQSVGGEAANSAVMLSKFGIKTRLDGNWLNPRNAEKVRQILKSFGIDISRLKVHSGSGTEEMVITDRNSRTVFGNYSSFHAGEKQWNDPLETDIRNASFIVLDPYFRQESKTAAELCVKWDRPYVTLDCKPDDYIAQHAEAVIISHELRDKMNMESSDLFRNYLNSCRGLIIFTFGAEELWFSRPGQNIRKFRPYTVTPVDTTGAGDAFRAGIAFGLYSGWNDEKTVDFASAVAACVCLTLPHTLNAPDLEGITAFMKSAADSSIITEHDAGFREHEIKENSEMD